MNTEADKPSTHPTHITNSGSSSWLHELVGVSQRAALATTGWSTALHTISLQACWALRSTISLFLAFLTLRIHDLLEAGDKELQLMVILAHIVIAQVIALLDFLR